MTERLVAEVTRRILPTSGVSTTTCIPSYHVKRLLPLSLCTPAISRYRDSNTDCIQSYTRYAKLSETLDVMKIPPQRFLCVLLFCQCDYRLMPND